MKPPSMDREWKRRRLRQLEGWRADMTRNMADLDADIAEARAELLTEYECQCQGYAERCDKHDKPAIEMSHDES